MTEKSHKSTDAQKCLLCNKEVQGYLTGLVGRYYYCRSCDLVGSPPPSEATISSYLDRKKAVDEGELAASELDSAYRSVYIAPNGLKDSYKSTYDDYGAVTRLMLDRIFSCIGDVSNLRILEIGGGDGELSAALANHPQVEGVTLVEPSPRSCEEARSRGLKDVYCGTVQEFSKDIDGREFDVVVIFGSLMLHSNPADTLKKAGGLLSSSGRLIFDIKNRRSLFRRVIEVTYRVGLGALSRRVARLVFNGPRFLFSKKSVRILCDRSGFDVLSLRGSEARVMMFPSKRYPQPVRLVAKLLSRLDILLGQGSWLWVCAEPKHQQGSQS